MGYDSVTFHRKQEVAERFREIRQMTALAELADVLGGASSPVRGGTVARVMKALAQQVGGGIQRDLAHLLQMSPGTVSKAIAMLRNAGLVEQEAAMARGPGHPVVPLRWTGNNVMIGITVFDRIEKWPNEAVADVMLGTLIGLDGHPPAKLKDYPPRENISEDARNNADRLVAEIVEFVSRLASDAESCDLQVLGCGLTLISHVDHGVIRQSYNIEAGVHPDQWAAHDGINLRKRLQDKLGMTVTIENDITSLGVLENLRPSYPETDYAIVGVLFDGIGGALVLNNNLWRGAYGLSGEPGHIPVSNVADVALDDSPARERDHDVRIALPGADRYPSHELPEIPVCRCGLAGHVQAFASPRSIIERAINAGIADGEPVSIAELASRSRRDHHKLSELFLQGGVALGRSLISAINWVNPQRIIVYLPSALNEDNQYLAGSYYLAGLRAEIRTNTFSRGRDTPITFVGSSSDEIRDRLATAAAYLVLAELIDQTGRFRG